MSKLLTRGLPLIAIAIFAVWGWNWWNSPERRIGRQLDALTDRISKGGDENALAAATNAREVRALFAAEFEVRAEEYGLALSDAGELSRALYQYRSQASTLSASADLDELTLGPNGRTATSLVTARVTGTVNGERRGEGYLLEVHWLREDDGVWRLRRVDLLEVRDLLAGGLLP